MYPRKDNDHSNFMTLKCGDKEPHQATPEERHASGTLRLQRCERTGAEGGEEGTGADRVWGGHGTPAVPETPWQEPSSPGSRGWASCLN